MKTGSALHKRIENTVNLWCTVVGLSVALLAFFHGHGVGWFSRLPQIPPTKIDKIHPVNDLFMKIGFLIGAIGLSFIVRDHYLNRSARRKFKRFREFFGESAVKDPLRLVHAKRFFDKKDTSPSKLSFFSPSAKSIQLRNNGIEISPKGIGNWLTAENNFAATAIATLFSETTKTGLPRIIYDSFVEDDTMPFCVVSLGLGFNEFTYVASDMTRGRMFRVVFKECVKGPINPESQKSDDCSLAITKSVTDEFVIPIRCVIHGCQEGNDGNSPKRFSWKYPKPPSDTDVSIIVRIPYQVNENSEYSTRFIVAGRTATGTAAAGAFLANHWDKLHELYMKRSNGEDPSEEHKDPSRLSKKWYSVLLNWSAHSRVHKSFGTEALLVVLEHKSGQGHDGHNVVHTNGTRFYCGDYGDLREENFGLSMWEDFENTEFDDAESVEKFSDSVFQNGYGFYSPTSEMNPKGGLGGHDKASGQTA